MPFLRVVGLCDEMASCARLPGRAGGWPGSPGQGLRLLLMCRLSTPFPSANPLLMEPQGAQFIHYLTH